jgi:uncharacterized delta-60 repeat protein
MNARSLLSRATAAACPLAALLLTAAAAPALPPGSLDPSFGTGGSVVLPLGSGPDPSAEARAVALQPDGKIVFAGYATDNSASNSLLVGRLDPSGNLDPTFGHGGKVVVQIATGVHGVSGGWSLAVQPDGKILVGGDAYSDSARGGFVVARLTPGGDFDSTFGDHGRASLKITDPDLPVAQALALQSDGRIVVAGTAIYSDSPRGFDEVMVGRLNANGTPDESFGDGGKVLVQLDDHPGSDGVYSEIHSVAIQPDHKIVVAGYEGGSSEEVVVGRLSGVDGSFDSGFGSGGTKLYQPFPNVEESGGVAEAVSLTPDGKILLGGDAYSGGGAGPAFVARLNGGDGSFDGTFGAGGQAFAAIGASATAINDMVLAPNGQIVVGGSATGADGSSRFLVARLNGARGDYDPSFGSAGTFQSALGQPGDSRADAIAVQPDGKIVAVGSAGSSVLLARVLGDPTADPGPAPGPAPGPQVQPEAHAEISALAVSPRVFAAASSGGSTASSTGARVAYTDSTAAKATFTVLKPTRGMIRGRRCGKPRRHGRGRRCTRWVSVGHFAHSDQAGANSFHFTGRIHRRKLRPGRYRLRARPLFNTRLGPAVSASFRIVRD